MERKQDVIEIDLIKLIRAMWHRAWAIILAAVIFGGVAFSYTRYMVTPLYESSAMLYVNNSTVTVGSTSVSLSDLSASQSLVDTYIVILKTRTMLEQVIEAAEVDYTYEQLYSMISAASVSSTEIFSITVTSSDPYEATRIANVIAELLPTQIAEIVDGSSARIVDSAVVPASKSSPSITKNTLMGILLGIVFSCGVIVLIELLDEQIRSEDDLAQLFELPVLAAIPDLSSKKSGKNDYYYGYGYGNQEAQK